MKDRALGNLPNSLTQALNEANETQTQELQQFLKNQMQDQTRELQQVIQENTQRGADDVVARLQCQLDKIVVEITKISQTTQKGMLIS